MLSHEISGGALVSLQHLYGNITVNDFFLDGKCIMALVITISDFIKNMYPVYNYHLVSGI